MFFNFLCVYNLINRAENNIDRTLFSTTAFYVEPRYYMTAKFCILIHIHSLFSVDDELVALNKNVICHSAILVLFTTRGCDSISENYKLYFMPIYFRTGTRDHRDTVCIKYQNVFAMSKFPRNLHYFLYFTLKGLPICDFINYLYRTKNNYTFPIFLNGIIVMQYLF